MCPILPKPWILIVDDDPAWLLVCTTVLKSADFQVLTANSAHAARRVLDEGGTERLAAVFSDLRMPGEDGISLIGFIRQTDATLSTILMTSEGDKALVTRALREGVHNFADKPIARPALIAYAVRAAAQTLKNRTLVKEAAATRALAESQVGLLGNCTHRLGETLHFVFRPLEKAGGDFMSVFEVAPQRYVVLITDVSGHDLRAALHASYYQGFLRGMLASGVDLELAFQRLNTLLLSESNIDENITLSLAACALCIDLGKNEARLINCGMPVPMLLQADGFSAVTQPLGSSPLGWFDELTSHTSTFKNGRLVFWSDGLEDQAMTLAVSPVALAYRLLHEPRGEDLLSNAKDDVLVAELNLLSPSSPKGYFPLLFEAYGVEDLVRIDEIQKYIEQSLSLALPSLGEEKLLNCIVSVREGLLNALTHGCNAECDDRATVKISYATASLSLKVEIEDPGKGHRFDVKTHEARAASDLLEEHRGLIMMEHLSSKMEISKECSRVTMEFETVGQ